MNIIFLMKNMFNTELSQEYFERRQRRHPVWKSEAEYKVFLLNLAKGGTLLDEFEKAMSVTANYLVRSTDAWVIDDDLIKQRENFFYLFYKRDPDADTEEIDIDNQEICKRLFKEVVF